MNEQYQVDKGWAVKKINRILLFKDILENDDVKLDNMFIASLVGDLVRVRTFLLMSALVLTNLNIKWGILTTTLGNDLSARLSRQVARQLEDVQLSHRQPLGSQSSWFRTARIQIESRDNFMWSINFIDWWEFPLR